MMIGKMNRRISLQSPADAQDGAGGYVTTWALAGVVWGEFKKPRVNTTEAVGAVVSDMAHEIHIRFRSDVTVGWRVVCSTHIYDVVHLYHIGRETTVMVCREMVK